MTDRISVQPTPIQRNSKDVAIELLKLHVSRGPVEPEHIEELYTKYYSLAETLSKTPASKLLKFIPTETKEILISK
ncbi:hypothetical protein FC756_08355 [Lysinibacillus mangiferihumi]|uniref:Uncharacterized protein n=1 Tax=Lysinibacillus mangiferihumi TaxID=1130819 RepID=A0A4U2Z778_9BACI|nr:hypothetical protein [Lysinibacillus mangiferihumi]TKI70107.1 hypothetical protein FC756_08355 [Lysinibacillus mangiferihumi]